MALSVSIWPQHKRTTQVCVREVITAFHCFFSPPLHSHTNPGLLTLRNSEITQMHKKENTTRMHTGSMGKFLTTSKRERRSSNPLGGKRAFSWVRLKKILKHFEPKYQLTHTNQPAFVYWLVFFKKSTHWECKFWPNICHSRGILYQDIYLWYHSYADTLHVTLLSSFFIVTKSRDLSEWPEGEMK